MCQSQKKCLVFKGSIIYSEVIDYLDLDCATYHNGKCIIRVHDVSISLIYTRYVSRLHNIS